MWKPILLIASAYACARSLRPTRFDSPKLFDTLCHRRGRTRVRPEVAMDLDELLAALTKAKDCTAAARMDYREAHEDSIKASIHEEMTKRNLNRAECDECEAQRAVDKHIAQITASHLEDEPEPIVHID